jgi:hypothetical protein
LRDQNGARQSLPQFLDRVLEEVRAGVFSTVVVDLRASPGGDYTKTVRFSEQLPKVLPARGRVFILVGPNTFSAALITAARLKYFAGAKGSLVGEPMGDRARFWAEGKKVTLPYSNISLRYSTAYHDWSEGCSWIDLPRCYLFNYYAQVAAGDLSPDVPVVVSFDGYAAGRDPVLEAVALARGQNTTRRSR